MAFLLCGVLVHCCGSVAWAELRGDVELLKLVALAHRTNMERLVTWQGSANIQTVSEDSTGPYHSSENRATFAYSLPSEATKWLWEVTTVKRRAEHGMEDCSGEVGTRGTIRKEGKWFHAAPHAIHADGRRDLTLVISPAEDKQSNFVGFDLDPRWYFTLHGRDVHDRLMSYYRRADAKQGTVTRNGDLVVFDTSVADGKSLTRHVFDLSKGGNLLEVSSEGPNVKTSYKYEFEECNGVWVCKSLEFISDAFPKKKKYRRIVRFDTQSVNLPIDPNEFSVESIGVKPGTRVSDHIAGIAYSYGVGEDIGSDFPIEDFTEETASDPGPLSSVIPEVPDSASSEEAHQGSAATAKNVLDRKGGLSAYRFVLIFSCLAVGLGTIACLWLWKKHHSKKEVGK